MFRTALERCLEDLEDPISPITTTAHFDDQLSQLMGALWETIQEEVPETKPPPFVKHWYSKELDTMRQKVNHVGCKSYKLCDVPDHPIHADYCQQRNRYGDQIEAAKRAHWDAWLEDTDMSSVWMVGTYICTGSLDGSKSHVPPLWCPASELWLQDNKEKRQVPYKSFFPMPPADTMLPPAQDYPAAMFPFTHVTDSIIHDMCQRLKEFKAPGPDGIPNEVYKRCANLLVPFLGPLFCATFDLEHYPEEWKVSIMVVLRKPGRGDYSVAKSYHPIALMSCMGKLLSACVASTLEHELESLGSYPQGHCGGCTGRTTTDSLHLLVKSVRDAWRRKEVASILFLDMEAVFPSAIPAWLFHEM